MNGERSFITCPQLGSLQAWRRNCLLKALFPPPDTITPTYISSPSRNSKFADMAIPTMSACTFSILVPLTFTYLYLQ